MNQSNWTGRTSRTMNEAFGAHCNESITPMTLPIRWSSYALAVVYVVAAIVLYFVV